MITRQNAKPWPQISAARRASSILTLLDKLPTASALLRAIDDSFAPAGRGDRSLVVEEFLRLFAGPVSDRRLNAYLAIVRRHGVATAYVARNLAAGRENGGDHRPEEPCLAMGWRGSAFVVGLLHDVGVLALAAAVPKSYLRVVTESQRIGKPLHESERALLGTDHAAAGAHLLRRWGFASELCESVRLHHLPVRALPNASEHKALARLVRVAEAVVLVADGAAAGFEDELAGFESGGVGGWSAETLEEAMTLAREELVRLDSEHDDCVGATAYPTPMPAGIRRGSERSDSVDAFEQAASSMAHSMTSAAPMGDVPTVSRGRIDWSEAVTRLLRASPGFCCTTDVCVAAAEQLAAVAGLDGCVVQIQDVVRGVSAVGSVAVGQRAGSFCRPVEPAMPGMAAARDDECALLPSPLRGDSSRIAPASDAWRRLWRRCGHPHPYDSLSVWSLVSSHAMRVWVLFADARECPADRSLSDEAAGAFATVLETIGRLISRHEAERERLDEMVAEMHQVDRNAQEDIWSHGVSMIGDLAAGAAHELNNPLAVVSGRAQMELARSVDPGLRKSLSAIITQAQRSTEIIRDLLAVAKPGTPNPSLHKVAELLISALQHWQAGSSLQAYQIRVGFLDPDLTVVVDPLHFAQVLHALLENAALAMNSKTAILQINSPARPTDEHSRIVIVDNGVGMEPRVLARAMNPFFSHRPAGRGRGLGLPRAVRLAELNGGKLCLESTSNVGTTATLLLPAR